MKVTDEMVDRLWDEIFDSDTSCPPAPSTLRRALEAALADVPEPHAPGYVEKLIRYNHQFGSNQIALKQQLAAAEAKLAKVREWALEEDVKHEEHGGVDWDGVWNILDGK